MTKIEDKKKVAEMIDSGEIVNMKSQLAYDEDLVCKRCSAMFTLAQGNYEGRHHRYTGVLAFGIKCPNCERVNISYYKTQFLIEMEQRLDRITNAKQKHKALNKYEKEFMRVQKRYGEFFDGTIQQKG